MKTNADIALEKLAALEASGHGTQRNGRIAKGAPVRIFVRDVAVAAGLSRGYRDHVSNEVLDAVSNELREAGLVVFTVCGKRFVGTEESK